MSGQGRSTLGPTARCWVAVWLLAAAPPIRADEACPEPGAADRLVVQGPLRAIWRTEPAAPRVSTPFTVVVTLCPARAELLQVDAHMPEHRHGMNYRPLLRAQGPGQWHAQGMVWHMPGTWELVLSLRLDGQPHRLRQAVEQR